ncbi:uncharacterized protein LOC143148736 [Ptiloglossa arizonensis]|uniref:uncharacterized protein LOC143148736 n=1 Tax=Ptiloglossa arizonensis TaxID=3350558 RepID=UPI003FA13496
MEHVRTNGCQDKAYPGASYLETGYSSAPPPYSPEINYSNPNASGYSNIVPEIHSVTINPSPVPVYIVDQDRPPRTIVYRVYKRKGSCCIGLGTVLLLIAIGAVIRAIFVSQRNH